MPSATSWRPLRRDLILALAVALSALELAACAGGGGSSDPCAAVDLSSDPANCGACGNACSVPNATSACVAGGCQAVACLPGFVDLDGGTNGCEYACPVDPPEAESCDGLDDDCDGEVDEGFDLAVDELNCGTCGNACSLPNAMAVCAAGVCQVVACQAGFADLDGGTNGCEYACPVNPAVAESCDGLDDDCDGEVDEGLATPPNFCVQTGPCSGAVPVCQGVAGWGCNYAAINPSIEVGAGGNLAAMETRCDGFDGNCNGLADESFPNKGKTCAVGVGRCATSATWTCAPDALSTVCNALPDPAAAVDELCNGIDDNCDGQVDERTPAGAVTCLNGGAHPCLGWIDPMVNVGSTWIYAYEASRPGATAASAGTLGTRACSAPGVQPWAVVTEPAAAAACAAVLDSAGTPMRLCGADEWTSACNVGVTGTAVWSYATAPTVFSSTTCNGYEAGFNAAWPTGAGASCYADQPGGRIYDMSGNVAEWTRTTVIASGTTYFKVRGGSYTHSSTGTNCNFDFTIEQPTYQYTNLGFRCCAENAP